MDTTTPLPPGDDELLVHPHFVFNLFKLGLEPLPDCTKEDLRRVLFEVFDLVGKES